jgi:hypothetical protein
VSGQRARTRSERVYLRLLRFAAVRLQTRYAEEMTEVFADAPARARARGRLFVAAARLQALADLVQAWPTDVPSSPARSAS